MLKSGDNVVVKDLKSKRIEEGFDEFQFEVSMISKLKHENFVGFHGVMLNPLGMVIEYCEKEDLFHAVQKREVRELRT